MLLPSSLINTPCVFKPKLRSWCNHIVFYWHVWRSRHQRRRIFTTSAPHQELIPQLHLLLNPARPPQSWTTVHLRVSFLLQHPQYLQPQRHLPLTWRCQKKQFYLLNLVKKNHLKCVFTEWVLLPDCVKVCLTSPYRHRAINSRTKEAEEAVTQGAGLHYRRSVC